MSLGLVTGLLVGMAVATPSTALPVSAGNALTLPAQRHVVRAQESGGRSVLLLAVQQGGKNGRALALYRSRDGGGSWSYQGSIDGGRTSDRADVLVTGTGEVALVQSIETPSSHGIPGSSSSDVWFQRWRYDAGRDAWVKARTTRVLDSTSGSTAYYRAELARDSRGRLWVQAYKRESDGSSSVVVAHSGDGGASFSGKQTLASGIGARGGGRMLSLGRKLLVFWSSHSGSATTKFRVRSDDWGSGTWSGTSTAFEGIYHGAAMSAVADGAGGAHVVYKDNSMRLRHRRFDGSRWGGAHTVEGSGNWATQPAVTRVGSSLYVFYNRPSGSGYALYVRRISSSGSVGGAHRVGDVSGFAGYPAGVDVMPGGTRLPFLVSMEPRSGGNRLGIVRYSPDSGSAYGDEGEAQALSVGAQGPEAAEPTDDTWDARAHAEALQARKDVEAPAPEDALPSAALLEEVLEEPGVAGAEEAVAVAETQERAEDDACEACDGIQPAQAAGGGGGTPPAAAPTAGGADVQLAAQGCGGGEGVALAVALLVAVTALRRRRTAPLALQRVRA